MAIFLNIIAKTMNAGGCAIVTAFDAGAAAFNCTMSALSPGERTKLGNRVKDLERKVHALTGGIAKETSKFADPAAALESEAVKALLNAVKELHREMEPLKQRIAEIDALKGVKKPQQEACGISSTISQSITGLLPGEKAGLQKRIFANEKKIQALYVEFAKEVAKQPDPYEAINSKAVAAINGKINELNAENSALKQQIADLAKPKEKPKAPEKKPQPDVKKPQPESAGVAKFFVQAITNSVSGYLPGEKSTIERKLAEHDKKIQGMYLEVAKESAKYPDPAEAVTAAPVVALVAKINDLKAEVAALNQRKAELSGVTGADKAKAAAVAAKAAVAAAKSEPVSEEAAAAAVTVEAPVEAAVADGAPVAPSETESAAGADGAAEATAQSDGVAAETAEAEEDDPTEGTPYVYSRTKSSDIPMPTLLPPTEEDIKAVVREFQAEEAKGEQVSEEVVPSSEEPSAPVEPVGEEEPAVAAEVPAETAADEAVAEADDQEASRAAFVEHPPLIPVPDAEEVFGLREADAAPVAAAEEMVQEEAVQEEAETAAEPAAESVAEESAEAAPAEAASEDVAAEATSEEVVENPPMVSVPEEKPVSASSARADAFGVAPDYSIAPSVSRPENIIKEESGFRTRLFRNQFSILTPVSAETPAPGLEPPSREEIETVVRGLQADDVEKYKLNEILDEQDAAAETAPDAEVPSEPEAAVAEVEQAAAEETAGEESAAVDSDSDESDASEAEGDDAEAEGTDVPDYYKKLMERRKGVKDPSAALEKSSPRKRK